MYSCAPALVCSSNSADHACGSWGLVLVRSDRMCGERDGRALGASAEGVSNWARIPCLNGPYELAGLALLGTSGTM